jgi:hypothetical protein
MSEEPKFEHYVDATRQVVEEFRDVLAEHHVDEAPVVNLLRRFEMLANRPDDQRLDVGGRHARTDPARSAAPWKRAEDR